MSFLLIVFAFLFGALPFGLYIAKSVGNIDPREAGSKNTGATNVARLVGTKYGVIVLVLDLLKGFLPVLMAHILSDSAFLLSLVMLAAVAGHVYSPFLGWKGGKGVATTVGVFLAANFWIALLAGICCLAVIALSGYVSMGSLTLAVCLPLFSLLSGNFELLPVGLILMGLMFWRHKENIERLKNGEEKSWLKSRQ